MWWILYLLDCYFITDCYTGSFQFEQIVCCSSSSSLFSGLCGDDCFFKGEAFCVEQRGLGLVGCCFCLIWVNRLFVVDDAVLQKVY